MGGIKKCFCAKVRAVIPNYDKVFRPLFIKGLHRISQAFAKGVSGLRILIKMKTRQASPAGLEKGLSGQLIKEAFTSIKAFIRCVKARTSGKNQDGCGLDGQIC